MLDVPAPTPFGFALSGRTDANGNASLPIVGPQAGVPAAFNLSLNVQGNAPTITILQGGFQLSSGAAINGDAQLGPILWDGSSQLQITVTNALPNTPITGFVSGVSSFDPQDLAAITGTTTQTVGTVTAYDGSTLIGENTQIHTTDVTYGLFDVRLWASVELGLRLSIGGPLLITMRWYANPDGTRLVGQRSMILSTDVATCVATVPNLGPYLQIIVNRILGSAFTWNASLLTSQRLVNDIFGGNFTPFLLEVYGTSIAQSTTVTLPLGTLYGGPIRWTFQNGSASPGNLTAQIQSMGTDGVFHGRSVDFQGAIAPNTFTDFQDILPPVPCQLVVTSAAAVGTYNFGSLIYSSATGGS